MRIYMSEYIKYVDKYINDGDFKDLDSFLDDHKYKISLFQHERLIHLLVTLFYGLLSIVFLFLTAIWIYFGIILLILLTFMVFYIRHYFFLEKDVQYMYKQYDNLKKSK